VGKAFLDMLGVFAEFETNLHRERQLEGISTAKARGVYKGRKPSIDAVEVLRLRREEKLGPAAIARRLGIGRASVYRLLEKEASVIRLDPTVVLPATKSVNRSAGGRPCRARSGRRG
jgi:DNA invertase Pin-like site-specific DNA recombinase